MNFIGHIGLKFNLGTLGITLLGVNGSMGDKNMFVVVRVHQDYDYVEKLEYVKSCDTEDEAKGWIAEKMEECRILWKARDEYVDKYMESIEDPPKMGYNDWCEYLKQFGMRPGYIHQGNFKERLKSDLKRAQWNVCKKVKDFDPPFNPPPTHSYPNDLYVMEINE
jgi:hypothetical protein